MHLHCVTKDEFPTEKYTALEFASSNSLYHLAVSAPTIRLIEECRNPTTILVEGARLPSSLLSASPGVLIAAYLSPLKSKLL